MVFLMAELKAGQFGAADRAAFLALATFALWTPEASTSHSTMGGQLMWL
jgi:hypothetical protein